MFIFRLITPDLSTLIDEPTVVTSIREPVKWSEVRLIGERDEWHGFNYDYSDGQLQLVFTKNAAAKLIRDNYDRYGVDAVIRFQVVDTSGNPEIIDYDGKLDLSDAVFEPDQVSCPIVRDDIHGLLKNRWETPISLSETQTLDGLTIAPPAKTLLNLPGQYVKESAELNRTKRKDESFEFSGIASISGLIHLIPDLTPDAGQNFAMDGLAAFPGGYLMPDILSTSPLLTCDAEGSYTFSISWIFKIDCALTKARWTDLSAVKFGKWLIEPVLEVRDPVHGTQKIALATVQTGSGEKNFLGAKSVIIQYNDTLEVSANTKIYLYCTFFWVATLETKATTVSVTTIQTYLKIERITRAAESQTVNYNFVDVAKHVFGAITSTLDDYPTGRLHGSLIDKAGINQPADGPATEYALTSGYHLRIADKLTALAQKSPSVSFKDIMQTLRGYHAAGMLYEKDQDGVESVRVEPWSWFYEGGEILRIDEVYAYKEEPDSELLVSQLEIGYEKYPDQGPGVAEEFNTIRTYQTPLLASTSKMEVKVPFVAAGTMIEAARRLSFPKADAAGNTSEDITAAGQYDDDIFLMHVQTINYSAAVQFVIEQPQPFPGTRYEKHTIRFLTGKGLIKPGDVIRVNSGPNSGRTYVAIAQRTQLLYREIEVLNSEPMTAGNETISFSLLGKPAKVRTNERLNVTGITDPSTTYNLELSPARMLLAHAPLIMPGCKGKRSTSELKLVEVKHNADMQTQAKDTFNLLPNDPDRLLVKEGKSVFLGILRRLGYYFSPEKITVSARLRRAQVRLLFDALKNKGDLSRRRGYVLVKNGKGEYVEGYVMRIEYNPCSEKVDLVLRKRFDSVALLPDCSNYAGWTFTQFQNDPNADPDLYLFCKFADLEQL